MLSDSRLYGIVDLGYVDENNAEAVTSALLSGGADILQLRAKNHDLTTIRRVALRLLPLCRAAKIPFILNDHAELAAEIHADGVHLGQDDGSLSKAREIFGASAHQKIFGRSTHSLSQARAALAEGVDYIGFGPLFPTPTKAGRPAIGVREISVMQRDVGFKIPAFCIGGITLSNLPEVLNVGAERVVIVSALLQADDIEATTAAAKAALAKR